jgi:hypothetical protein
MISIDHIPNVESLGNALPFVGRIREIIEAIKLFEDFEPDELEGLARYMRCYRAPLGTEDHSRGRRRRLHGAAARRQCRDRQEGSARIAADHG